MTDDYLWDGSGEPDPDIEHLEQALGRYRHSPAPVALPAPPRRMLWPQMAAAAALVLMILAGLWVVFLRSGEQAPDDNNPIAVDKAPAPPVEAAKPGNGEPPQPTVARAPEPRRSTGSRRLQPRKIRPEAAVEDQAIAFFDADTVKHIEKAEILLRSFRNAEITESESTFDTSYEKERSSELLTRNAQLRQTAAAKGNLPAEELLGSLEPFLLDISNLPDRPSQDDVRSIKERIKQKEIISTLQVYSAPVMARTY